jgi:hypothetical protein
LGALSARSFNDKMHVEVVIVGIIQSNPIEVLILLTGTTGRRIAKGG